RKQHVVLPDFKSASVFLVFLSIFLVTWHTVRPVRCAIYTRKSSEEGLEQDFNSLDAQRAAAEAYIQSQKQEGWQCLRRHYDDGGFTGANMDRPALKTLLADIAQGQVDCVLVYKVDRLSRSLLDFARIIETFEKHRVANTQNSEIWRVERSRYAAARLAQS